MIRTELTLRLPNSPGAAASVCQLLATERVQISALSLSPAGHLRLIVDNPVRAFGALRDQHHHVETRDVVWLGIPSTLEGLGPLLTLISQAGVNIEYAYMSAGESGPGRGVILGVDDPQRAAAAAGV